MHFIRLRSAACISALTLADRAASSATQEGPGANQPDQSRVQKAPAQDSEDLHSAQFAPVRTTRGEEQTHGLDNLAADNQAEHSSDWLGAPIPEQEIDKDALIFEWDSSLESGNHFANSSFAW
mmetsp:Transcript_9596/g.15044  ORF Transcript_9596/g.15044 Transcript_9596/m.15044 type:complete len:123 (+) Transcript_9596:149-517(+)